MSTDSVDTNPVLVEYRNFMAGFQTLIMATVSQDGSPEASYASFIQGDDGCFYVYVSEFSKHTRNMLDTGRVSIMFIEDERDLEQPFARKRLTFDCRLESILRDSEDWLQAIERFTAKFGDIVATLRELSDFKLLRIVPLSGKYVRGFGQAYRIEGNNLDDVRHIGKRDLNRRD